MPRSEPTRALPQLLLANAGRFPGKVAYRDDTRSVGYAELAQRTGRAAGHLAALGLRRGDRVVLMLGNTVAQVEAYLAVLRAAGTGVPVNHLATVDELAYLVADSGARLVFAEAGRAAEVRAALPAGVTVVSGGAEFERLATTDSGVAPRDDLGLDEVAWMLYTSGTTGRPKGVLSTQRSCLWSIRSSYEPLLGLHAGDHLLWPLPMFHSLSHILAVVGVTAAGASARILPGFAAEQVAAELTTGGYTVLAGVPTMYHYLTQEARRGAVRVDGLRVCLCTGAVASAALRATFLDAVGVRLLDSYGSTETCGAITMSPPQAPVPDGSCGLPVPGLDVRIADPETGAEAPAGAEGEVWVRGPSLMLGYHERPEATAEALRDGWYHTGDLARRDAAGHLTISGRIKDLIIRGGENIHPGEIDEVLREIPGVTDAAAAGEPDEVLGEQPVGYVVLDAAEFDVSAAFATLRARLSYYKVPVALYAVEAIPRTVSGKITRHRLAGTPARLLGVHGRTDSLFRLTWTPAEPARGAAAVRAGDVLDLTPAPDPAGVRDIVLRAAELLEQRLAGATGRLTVVTRGAVAVRPGELPEPTAAAVHAMAAARAGTVGDRMVLVDVDDPDAAVAGPAGEARLAVRGGHSYVPRLVRAAADGIPAFPPDETVVVTGARRREVAQHLAARHGVRHLVVDGEPDGVADALAGLGATHGRDANSRVAAIVHTSADEDPDEVWELHRAHSEPGGPALVLFTTAAPALGVPAEPERAAAAGFAGALAVRRRAAGLQTVTLARGPAPDDDLAAWPGGCAPLTPAQALSLFSVAMMSPEPELLPVAIDVAALGEVVPPVLRALAPTVADRLGDLSEQQALTVVLTETSAVLGLSGPADVQPGRTFQDHGLTSATAVELRNRLIAATGRPLAATAAFDHPSPQALARHLAGGESATAPAEPPADPAESIAIVAMSCRYPGGVGTPEELWELITEGREAMTAFPGDRGWDVDALYHPDPDHPGTSYVRTGGFLTSAAAFDAELFGISPREALAMDPQQRLLLEISWEAFERARIDPLSLGGSGVGVFVGAMFHDYATRLDRVPGDVEGFLSTGTAGSVLSGRIAYAFGLQGTAVTVDTACSSSLVALHLAAQALRQGECSLALAGGVAVMATPAPFLEFSRQRALAADGRCKPFAAAADGTAWGEGAGMIVLERLSDAQRHGHPVLAVLRGSAVNQDGASNGLTAPNGPAQTRVIRRALASAGLEAADVDAVEAHGTGTRLGDPIEASAVIAAYGPGRPANRPLRLGSVKANIGHTQAAAGVAGVIKMVLGMRHGILPRTLHQDAPTPYVDWSAGTVELLPETVSWPVTGRPRRAGVSSFGVSGTNAHVILEEAPQDHPATPTAPADLAPELSGPTAWMLSGNSPEALRAQAERLAAFAGTGSPDLAGIAATLTTGRARLEHRAGVIGRDREDLVAGLRALAAGAEAPGVVTGVATRTPIAFVFPGQGTQWPGMVTELLATSPVFRASVEECDAALREFQDWSVRDLLAGADGAPSMERTDVVQPVLFTTMVSLAALWRSVGVEPAAVVGHSQGEIAAAYVCGALSLRDAARIIALRSQAAQRAMAGAGSMTSILAPREELERRLPQWAGRLSIAAINGPAAVTVAGDRDALTDLEAELEADGIRARRIRGIDLAAHSPQVDAVREELLRVLAPVTPGPAPVAFYSTVTGGPGDTTALDGDYWFRNMREIVEFDPAVRALAADRITTFLEISTHPVLQASIESVLDDAGVRGPVLSTLKRDEGGLARVTAALAEADVAGVDVDWTALLPPDTRRVDLPTYAFQRRDYWLLPAPAAGDAAGLGLTAAGHPLLGAAVEQAGGRGVLLTGRLSAATHSWLYSEPAPVEVLVEMALRGCDEAHCERLGTFTVEAPLPLSPTTATRVQVTVTEPDDDGRSTVEIFARRDDDTAWTRLAHGMGERHTGPVAAAGEGDTIEVRLPDDVEPPAGFGIHPHLLAAALRAATPDPGAVATEWRDVVLHATGATDLRVRLTPGQAGGWSLTATDGADQLVLTASAVRLGTLAAADPAVSGLYRVAWTALPQVTPGEPPAVTDVPALLADPAAELPATVVLDVPARPDDEVAPAVHEALRVIQTWLTDPRTTTVPLVVLTHRDDLPGAAVGGLVRSAQSEEPGRLVLVDIDDTPASRVVLHAVVGTGEPELALRDGVLTVPRLVPVTAADDPAPAPTSEGGPAPVDGPALTGGTALITGGTGAIGRLVARDLAARGEVAHLLLVGRRGADAPGAPELAEELRDLGVGVTVARADAADRAALAAAIAAVPAEHPLTVVVHAAGALDDGVVGALTPERVDTALRAKVDGARHLHELTAGLDLREFVLFSSIAGTVGTAGQANYAAANAFLDAFARSRHRQGRPALAVPWGLWAERSELTGHLSASDLRRIGGGGIAPLTADHGLALLRAARAGAEPVVVAADFDVAELRELAAAGTLPAVLSDLPGTRARRVAAARSTAGPGLADRLAALLPAERRAPVEDLVREHAAAVLGHDSPRRLSLTRTFKDLGFDSLTGVQLRNRLRAATGLTLGATLVFDHPTGEALVAHLLGELTGAPAGAAAPVPVTVADADDPIVIVAMSCRFPAGVRSPEELWQVLDDGVEAVGGFPTDRGWDLDSLWSTEPGRPGTTTTRTGAFLYDAPDFDAEFFGISPREATAMDPQQRILLETAWEAVERAGIDPVALRGSRTGVFVGANGQDYVTLMQGAERGGEGYLITGSAASVMSGRIAYQLGLEGPAVTVDTACSSSLVALHLAAQALRAGECDLALAGGVTVLSTPGAFIEFSRQGGLAPDGRCKTFAAAADGTGWGEGAGMLLVERLSDARRRGHRVLALLRGSAVNQDGASNGLTAPNGPSQQRVIRQALANAGLSTADVDAVEAHGTATVLGDPIEAQALLATYGQDRPADRPLWLGSVKSNIGHTQAAAGVAGVMKTVLALQHGVLPRTLHVDEPTPHVDWSAGAVSLLREAAPWPETGRARRAAVSSFGISGTNAHVILEQAGPAEDPEAAPEPVDRPLPWVVSAATPAALRDQARHLLRYTVGDSPHRPVDVALALATTRTGLRHRAAVTATDSVGHRAGLMAIARGESSGGVVTGTVEEEAGPLGFLFTGQGSQRAGMGRDLAAAYPVFAAALDDVLTHVDAHLDRPLRELMFADEEPLLDQTVYTQPAIFAFEVALYRLLESLGVRPALLAGHSVGEFAAAHVAGVLSLADAALLITTRARLMQRLDRAGAMASVAATEAEVHADLPAGADVAAVNGPESVVVSGDSDVVDAVVALWSDRGRRTRRLRVSHAFHSWHMDEITEEFRAVAQTVAYAEPAVPIVSTLTGRPATGDDLRTADYWTRHLRLAVRFADAVRAVEAAGVRTFVEVGPDAILSGAVGACLTGAEPAVVVPAQHPRQPEAVAVAAALARLWVHGHAWDTGAAFDGLGARPVELPTYAFQRRRYWWATPAAAASENEPWCYQALWRPLPEPVGLAAEGTWLVVAEDGGLEPATRALTAAGARVVTDPADAEPLAGVLCALDLPKTVALLQTLHDAGSTARVWSVTFGAMSTGAGDRVADPVAAQVWGLGRVAALELPQLWGGVVDLPSAPGERVWQRLIAVVTGGAGEDQVAIRDAGVFGRRLVRTPAFAEPEPTPVRPAATDDERQARRVNGTILITGGTGGLGAQLARRLAAHSTQHLLLVSRSGEAAPGAAELRAELTGLGAAVSVAACDVTDREAVAALLASIPADRPLAAAVHAAGVLDDGVITSLTPERLDRVLRVKVDGARHLHELTAGQRVGALVLFSSFAGAVGGAGQANYAAANAYLDALAEQRREDGLPATAVAWGPWAGAGMAAGAVGERLARDGVRPMPPERALAVLERLVQWGGPSTVVTDLDVDRFAASFTAVRPSPLLAELAPAAAAPRVEETAVVRPTTAAELLALVRFEVAAVLGHGGPGDVDPNRAFQQIGFDSLTAVELRNRLATALGRTLPATAVFDYPTPAALADFLHRDGDDGRQTATAVAVLVDEPIAIVGMACHFPGGVRTPDEFWRLLSGGGDAMAPFPADRGWDLDTLFDPDPDHPGTTYATVGGFLHGAGEFDAGFFGVSPREAIAMDPQQRLLLEAAWEAVEQAGIDPATLRGTDTGVFAGTNGGHYAARLRDVPAEVEGYLGTGNSASVTSGRIAYTLGLEGPAVTIDTACSSSLVAIHWAAQALLRGECRLALAGGVTVMASPEPFVDFSRQRGLAPDGRCKAFAGSADGTGWGEGAGVLVLERLSDAQRLGHRVLAVVRGSAVNQDGASNGLTAPNGPSQQRVIRQALANAGVEASGVDVVEAHGTGTRLGDPIEAQALLATYGQDRDRPLWLGSVKSNIGHTQAAAGVAGVIKMVLAMHHDLLPQTLHVDEPTTEVDWTSGEVRLLTEAQPWQRNGHPRRAGVSSFGISGTNAHVILEEAPPAEAPVEAADRPVPVLLSARTDDALRAQADRLRRHLLDRPDLPLTGVARALALTRSAFDRRTAITAADRDELLSGLRTVARVGRGATVAGARVAVLFSGQGSQRPGMTRELYATQPVYAQALDEVCARFDEVLDRPLRPVIFEEGALLHQTAYTQAALFAVEVALYRLIESWGVVPAYLVGHSIGELTAAHIAGVLDLPDAVRLVAARGRLMQELPPGGAMVAVQTTEDEARALIGDDPRVSVAAVNAPSAIVLAGEEQAVLPIAERLTAAGHKTKRLTVSHAFHSALMDPMLEEFRRVAAAVAYAQPSLPVVSNVSGALAGPGDLTTADYWVRHVRNTVRFADGVAALDAEVYLEIGPGAALTPMAAETLDGRDRLVLPLLRADRPDGVGVAEAVGRLWSHGVPLDLAAVLPAGDPAPIPTYAFRREHFWLLPDAGGHSLLGAPVALADGSVVHSARINAGSWLADLTVDGRPVLPAGATTDALLHAAAEAGCTGLADLTVEAPFVLSARGGAELQIRVMERDEGGYRAVSLYARRSGVDGWTVCASGRASAVAPTVSADTGWLPAGAVPVPLDFEHDRVGWGPAQRIVTAAWRAGDRVYADLRPGGAPGAALTALSLLTGRGLVGSGQELQRLSTAAPQRLRFRVVGDAVTDVELLDDTGRLVLRAARVTFAEPPSDLAGDDGPEWLYRVSLVPHRLAGPVADAPTAVTVEDPAALDPAASLLVLPVGTAPGEPGASAAREATTTVLSVVRRLLADDGRAGTHLVVLTRDAVPAASGAPVDPAHAAVWGLIRAAQAEQPGRFSLVDADDTVPAHDLAAALADPEPQLVLRGGQAFVPRLVPAPVPAAPAFTVDPAGTVLITGGTGGLGRELARHLVASAGVRRLVLAGRRGADAPGAAELRDDLTALGAEVTLAACDLADAARVRELVAGISADHPLTAVVHAAGVNRDSVIAAMTDEQVDEVFRAKVDAVLNLHAATLDADLGAFVLFSSASGILGGPGQGNYAAANAFLDAFAQYRAAQGRPALSLAWGLWEARAGMAGKLTDADLRRMRRGGIAPLATADGLALFDRALRTGEPALVPVRLDVAALRFAARTAPVSPPLRDLVPHQLAPVVSSAPSLASALAGLSAADRDRALSDLVRTCTATVLGHAGPAAVDPDRGFLEQGLDSLTAVELRNRLAVETGQKLSATVVFDHPSPAELAAHLGDLLPRGAADPVGPLDLQSALDRIAVALGTAEPGEPAEITRRLEQLLRAWEGRFPQETAIDLESASLDEVLGFINDEFGYSQ
ncbi:SDR family NAD(P)-dependent oxidoreductase [Verrucosispora sp. TAA-831]|uniref:SDR family NAD(P)-dependent oxidoreductase n=1 Tax=Verrucosispora sp. TAA-831 TaxID=3422227 RepID=UPI003D6E6005